MPRGDNMKGYYVHLDAEPFLRQFDMLGMSMREVRKIYGCGAEQFITRSRRNGWMTDRAADRWAIAMLGLTVWDLWPTRANLVA